MNNKISAYGFVYNNWPTALEYMEQFEIDALDELNTIPEVVNYMQQFLDRMPSS